VGRGVFDGPLFHLGDSRGHGDHDPRGYQFPMVDLLDEVPEHRLRNLEIGDDPVLHGTDCDNIAGRASKHSFGFIANGQDICGARLDCYNRRFAQYNPSIPYEYEGVGRPKVYSNVIGKQAFKLR
jgi:hypothetical protein